MAFKESTREEKKKTQEGERKRLLHGLAQACEQSHICYSACHVRLISEIFHFIWFGFIEDCIQRSIKVFQIPNTTAAGYQGRSTDLVTVSVEFCMLPLCLRGISLGSFIPLHLPRTCKWKNWTFECSKVCMLRCDRLTSHPKYIFFSHLVFHYCMTLII